MSDALRQVFAEFGIAWEGSALERGSHQVDGMIDRAQRLASVLAGSRVLGAIFEFANAFEETAGQLEDTANVMGTTTDELQELQRAGVGAGLSAEATSAALSHLQQASADAARGAKGPADAFRALGVRLKDSDGQVRSTADVMDDLSRNFAGITDPARRAQLAQDLFGRSGARMANILHEGEGGLAALRAEVEELGGGTLPEAVEAAGAYGDAMDRQRVASQSLRSVLAIQLLPALTWLTTQGTKATAWLVKMTRDTNTVRVAMIALGVAGAIAGTRFLASWGPTLLQFARVAAVVAVVALAVDDLLTLLDGGDSAIGRFLDSMGGAGTSARFVTELKLAWEGVQLVVHDAGAALEDFGTQAGTVLDSASEKWRAFTSGAREMVDAAMAAIRSALESVGVPVDAIARRVEGVLGAVRGFAGRAVDRAIQDVTPAPSSGNSSTSFLGDLVNPRTIMDEWRGVFGGGALAGAAPAVASQAPGARPQNVTHDNRTTNSISVTGVTDPRAAAAEAMRLLDARERARNDAAHPTNAND